MAYELKRGQRIQEEIKVGDTVVAVDLHVDSVVKAFNRRYNDIIAAEREIKKLQARDQDMASISAAMTAYGEAVIALFGVIFGDEGTQTILEFYEDNYFEMSVEVFPFIINVVVPQMQKSIEAQRKQLAEQYKPDKRRKMGS
jgi:hypothetical protein